MQKSINALAELRAHWKAEGCPSIAKIAKKANVPSPTANRYLTGVTKGGAAETIRALAIAMDRRDIAESLPYTGSGDNEQDYIAELLKQWDEATQQRLAEADARHKQEMDDLTRDHRLEREDWHKQRNALYEENANLRKTFDSAIRVQRAERWITASLFVLSVLLLISHHHM